MVELLQHPLTQHPLTVLLFGALVSGVLLPKLTRRWQNHQKALEIKTELVSDLSKSVMGMVVATQFAHVGAKSQEQAVFDQAYRDWEIDSAVIGTRLQAYFPDTTIPTEWTAFSALVTDFYALEGVGADRRSRFAADPAKRLGVPSGDPGARDWPELKNAILERKSALIQHVLKAAVSGLK